MVGALKFFLGKDPDEKGSDDSDSDNEIDPKEVMMANKVNKKSRKREKQLTKVKKLFTKAKKKKSQAPVFNFSALQLIHDPQGTIIFRAYVDYERKWFIKKNNNRNCTFVQVLQNTIWFLSNYNIGKAFPDMRLIRWNNVNCWQNCHKCQKRDKCHKCQDREKYVKFQNFRKCRKCQKVYFTKIVATSSEILI